MDWKQTLINKIELDPELDEKYADGVWDLAHEITDEVARIFVNNNEGSDLTEVHFPDEEIACRIYDIIKYGK